MKPTARLTVPPPEEGPTRRTYSQPRRCSERVEQSASWLRFGLVLMLALAAGMMTCCRYAAFLEKFGREAMK